ncbi:non-ribosomal peptide synthetase [Pandoraea anhela]|uniref:Linear gramicidin synthase subunit B n=1 Tax=Pandoraea anhela TaxID=2508295 RepID=A0A5E4WQM5_9BURK|nr:non-ribosomal peptide synthetase [Pandoraea anhela]VVE25316.1 Linear gramicidin synthase subunit B [Pandoraea anhela]
MDDIQTTLSRLAPTQRQAMIALLERKGVDVREHLPLDGWAPRPHAPAGEPAVASVTSAASFAQQRMWTLLQLDDRHDTYHITGAVQLDGDLDTSALAQAFAAAVARHAALRTTFDVEDGKLMQRVHACVDVPLDVVDLATSATDATDATDVIHEADVDVRDAVAQASRAAFDLARGPLVRTTLLRVTPTRHVLVLTMHHLISDGGSLDVLIGEIARDYALVRNGQTPAMQSSGPSYGDYAIWQRMRLGGEALAGQLDYWATQLADADDLLALPLDRHRPAQRDAEGGRVAFTLPEPLAARVRDVAREAQTTPFAVLLASFQALLARYAAGQSDDDAVGGHIDVRVGVPVSHRSRTALERVVGCFVNTVVVRAKVDPRAGFGALLAQVRDTLLDAQRHADVPFEQVVERLAPARSLSHSPLFQVMVNHQRRHAAAALQLPGVTATVLDGETTQAKFDLDLGIVESPDGTLGGGLGYACDVFSHATAQRICRHWQTLLSALLAQPASPLQDLPLADADELAAIRGWGDPAKAQYDDERLLPDRIASHAALRPHAHAVECDGDVLTYGDLLRRADTLAAHLLARGLAPETRVGVRLDRSANSLVAMLAVLRAGGAYVPLDVEHPDERVAELCLDAGIALVVTDAPGLARLPAAVAGLDIALATTSPAREATLPALHPAQLAYVIFTSGSTGRPKGVAVSHGPIAMHCRAIAGLFGMTPAFRELHVASLSFDGAHERWLTLLSQGACVVLRGPRQWTPEEICEQIVARRVTNAGLPTALLRHVAQWVDAHPGAVPPGLIYSCGGEALSRDTLSLVMRTLQPSRLLNGYGPTETVVTPVNWTVQAGMQSPTPYAPIGSLVGQRRAYVLDARLQPVPVGVAGELYLGGEGVARGYLARPGQSAERFVPDPWGTPGARMYRTGDRVRWLDDGTLEYLGRRDQQLKVRGFRIEPGEVEAQLLAETGVREAVVGAAQGPAGVQLIAHVSATRPDGVDATAFAAQLHQSLAARLPSYLVPAQILVLDALPKLVNGKLDRKRLPEPVWLSASAEAPRAGAETDLAAIWTQLLGAPQVGRADNFFALGGDSIIALQLVSRAREADWRITVRDVFRHQTLSELAAVAVPGQVAADGGPSVSAPGADVPLSPIQAWFFSEPVVQRDHWNQWVQVDVRDGTPALDAQTLLDALQAVATHHEALQMRYVQVNGVWQSRRAPSQALLVALDVVDAADESQALAAAERAQRGLSLSDGPLLRAVLVNLKGGRQRLLLVCHHIAVDGVSWRILLGDLQRALAQREAGQPVALAGNGSTFGAWATYWRDWASSPEAKQEAQFWTRTLQGAHDALPVDATPANGDRQAHAAEVTVALDGAATRRLLGAANDRARIHELLVAALAQAVGEWTGAGRVALCVEGHGRDEVPGTEAFDLTRTLGWFTSVYPVAVDVSTSPRETLFALKRSWRAIARAGLGFGALRYHGDDEVRAAMAALPQGRVTFNYLGRIDAGFGEGRFAPSDAPAGAARDAAAPLGNWLCVDGAIADGCLRLHWRFSRERFHEATIAGVAARMRAALDTLVGASVDGQLTSAADFPLANLSEAELAALPVPLTHLEDAYPLSPMQQGMVFHARLAPDSASYINQLQIRLEGLQADAFAAAWQAAVRRHAILRTSFVWRDDAPPLQLVHREVPQALRVLDWRERVAQQGEGVLSALAQEERAQGFDLASAPLQRVVLVHVSDEGEGGDASARSGGAWQLIWTLHHVLLDGWSSAQLIGEILQAYLSGTPDAAGPAPRFRDYIAWLDAHAPRDGESFWRERLAAFTSPTQLHETVLRTSAPQQGHGERTFRVEAASAQAWQRAARARRLTVNTLMQGAWTLLLQRYTGKRDVCFGVTVSGRPAELPGAERMMGLFINTLPVLQGPTPSDGLDDWLHRLQEDNLALREAESTPLYDIQRWVGWPGQALFDSLIVFENYPVDRALRAQGAQALRFGDIVNVETTHYPLTIGIASGETIDVRMSYDRRCFDDAAVERLWTQLHDLLSQLCAAQPSTPLRVADVVLHDSDLAWPTQRGPRRTFDVTTTVDRTIAAFARTQPEAIAVTDGERSLTYAELEAQANRVAHALLRRGVTGEDRVGIALSRRVELIVAILGVMKAGAAYVPLDPAYPDERLAYVVEDAGIDVVVTDAALGMPLWLPPGSLSIDALARDTSLPPTAPEVCIHVDQLAYVIYTSGSTGRPKGVPVAHRQLMRLLQSTEGWFGFGTHDVWTMFHSYAFDVSVWEIFGALSHGGRLVVVPYYTSREPRALWTMIEQQRVTVLCQTPSAFYQILAALPEGASQTSLRHIVLAGEALTPRRLAPWWSHFGAQTRIVNMYGPTETTVYVSYGVVTPEAAEAGIGQSPIGEALPDIGWRVLDASLAEVPMGVPGDLYVGGDGLARGYLGRPGLSAERFVPDPWGPAGARMYQTGDRVRRLPDGTLDYLGRGDQQVKLRGFRIEPGEIEAQLLAHDDVSDAAVIVRDDGLGEQLVAYVVASAGDDGLWERLREHLATRVPSFMMPGQWLRLDALPLTPNGKLDRRALPAPHAAAARFVPPEAGVETDVAAVWQTVLGVARVGRHDNFFALGGHSLLATQMVARLQAASGRPVALRQLFETPVLSDFCAAWSAVAPAALDAHARHVLDDLLGDLEADAA